MIWLVVGDANFEGNSIFEDLGLGVGNRYVSPNVDRFARMKLINGSRSQSWCILLLV
jgi:hypothetical protein